MRTFHKITPLVIFIFLVTACQKKSRSDQYKKASTLLLNRLDDSKLKDSDKEKTLDSLGYFLLKQENDSINRNLLFKIIRKYDAYNKNNKSFKLTQKVLKLSSKAKDTSHMAKALLWKGVYYKEKSYIDSAFSYYTKSEKLYLMSNDTLMQGWIAMLKGGILFETGNFAESETETIKALQLLTKTPRIDLVFNCYNRIALSLKGLNNYKKSLAYFELALKQLDLLEKENKLTEYIIENRAYTYNNIGWMYESVKNYPEAIRFYNKGLQIKDLRQIDPKPYAMLLDNLAHAKMQTRDYNRAYNILLESTRINDSLDIKSTLTSNKINMGEYFLLKKDTAKALAYIKDGFDLSRKIEYSELTLRSLKLLMENDSKNKTFYTNQYIKTKDSLQEVERATRNKFARIAYETDLIEEENQVLTKRNTYIMGIASLVALFSIVFFIIYRLKSKNKELLLIKEQQEANEKIYQLMLNQQSENEAARNEERNRIAMELHDGIVNSIFTTRFNLIQLEPNQTEKKQQLVDELENAEKEIRRVSHDLQQNLLFEDKNLPEIITNLVAAQQNEFNTQFDFSADKHIDWSKVATNDKIHIYRIVQEAIQNINKYAKAEKGLVFLLKTGDKITIRIWDNGIGFKPEKVKQGIGLKNIKERVAALNGKLKITSEVGKGTTIEVAF